MSEAARHATAGSPPSLAAPTGLTDAQQQVVYGSGGPLLVVAGPGAGKTRTLTARLQYLLATGQAQASEMVAVTFTRKAAAELQTRLESALGDCARAITVGTFHRLALLLRPLPEGTALISEGDRVFFCERALEQLGSPAGSKDAALQARRAVKLAQALSLLKGQRSDFMEVLRCGGPQLAELTEGLWRDDGVDFAAAVQRYQELLAGYQAEDLDDLLLQALKALRLGTAPRAFRHVAVDEYQDVSGVQRELIQALGRSAEVLAIGDPDQAIYAFRGAQVRHFHAFASDFPAARTIYLRENFRSAANLVEAAAAVIAHNPDRTAPPPLPVRPAGAPITRFGAASLLGEALLIVREIERLVGGISLLSHDTRRAAAWSSASYSFSDVAVLTRTARRADELAAALQQEGVPILRPRRAHLDSGAARDLLAYLRLCTHPDELGADVGALLRVLRLEARNLGLPIKLAELPTGVFSPAARFAAVPEPLRTVIAERVSGLVALPLPARLAALAAKLGTPEKDAAAVRAQLERLEPQALPLAEESHETDEWEPEQERVAVLTLHSAKGLEFPVVFVAGCEAGLLPGRGCSDAEVAEERRLFYVGLTRAQDRLYVSCVSRDAATAAPADQPSPFLDELPAHLVDRPAPPKRKPKPPQLKLF